MIKARALDLDFFSAFFMNHHCVLAFSKMHRQFFEDDRKHIDALLAAEVEAESFRDNSDYPNIRRELVNAARGYKEVDAAPRGNAKSTLKTRIRVIRDVCYQLERFIVVFSNTGGQAEGRVWEIMRELSKGKNPKIERHFGQVSGEYAPYKQRLWTRAHFITNTGIRVMAASMMSESRGIADGENRPTLVIFDDLENNEHVMSPVQRAKAADWFTKVPLKLGGPNTPCNFSFAGTVLHADSLLAQLLKNPGWRGRKFQSIITWPTNQTLWDECKAIWADRTREDREGDARAFYEANKAAMDEGSEVLWNAGEPLYALMVMLWTDGEAAFYSEKQNEPRDPSKQVLKIKPSNFYQLKQNALGRYEIHRLDGRVVPLQECSIVGWLDPAAPKTTSVDPDFAAIVALAVDRFGYGYVLDVWMRQVQASVFVRQLIEMHKRWHFDSFGFEDNGFQELIREPLRRYCEEEYNAAKKANYTGFPYWDFPARGFTQTGNKVERVSKLEAPFQNDWLLVREGLQQEFIDQITGFPTASHDDGPDALEAAWTLGVQKHYTPQGANFR